jgi:YVTN family beta-propeller protein
MSRRVQIARLLATTLLVTPTVALAQQGYDTTRVVGPQADGSIVASNNQTLTPAGTLVNLGAPLLAKAVAVNPVNKTAAVLLMSGPEDVVVFNTVTGAVIQNFKSASSAKGSFNGIAYSADGTKLFYSQDSNHFVTANVNPTTGMLTLASNLTLPTVATAFPSHPYPFYNSSSINPGGIAISRDGTHAYVVLNAANTLGVVNLATSTLQAQVPVGNVPNSVVVSADGRYAYVSNEGGRPANAGEYTNPSDGTAVVADPTDAFATTGTVSVIDLTTNTQVATIDVGLHPTGMTISGTNLFVANAYSDTISVVDLTSNQVVRTIDVGVPVAGNGQGNGQNHLVDNSPGNSGNSNGEAARRSHPFGSGPNGIAVVDGRTAYVTLGQANAIAVIDLASPSANQQIVGYIPTAYFPTSIAYDAVNKQLVVADDKGVGANTIPGSAEGVPTSAGAFNTHYEAGRVSLIPLPNAHQLAVYSEQVINNNHWKFNPNISVGAEFVDSSARPVPVPQHIGEPSTIKHVFLIIKENRTYDQMLGDLPQGNGDPSIAIFAPDVPNQHAFVKRFPLLDNTYAPSRQSADGHPWIVTSGSFYSNDILSPDWIRSYPGGNSNDAMTYTPRGFLWSAAQKKGLSVKLYGEWSNGSSVKANPTTGKAYAWGDFYNTSLCIEGRIAAATCQTLTQVPFTADSESSNVPSAQSILDPHYPSFNLTIPDQYRADYWLPIFQQQVATNAVPNLTIMWLPDDHTNGTSSGSPSPHAYQADNDLALGRIVEAISNSTVWKDSAIFVEEDDTQDGVDHVDGHRMPAYVISPWTAPPQAPNQGKVVHTIYTQENINRTIEQILGLEPLTQFDLVASPMFDVFGTAPDLTPYTHVPAAFALNQSGTGTLLGWSGLGASYGELKLDPIQKAWIKASDKMTKGTVTKADAVDENFLNHSIWYSATNWKRPYPGETEILMPASFVKAAAEKAKTAHERDDD